MLGRVNLSRRGCARVGFAVGAEGSCHWRRRVHGDQPDPSPAGAGRAGAFVGYRALRLTPRPTASTCCRAISATAGCMSPPSRGSTWWSIAPPPCRWPPLPRSAPPMWRAPGCCWRRRRAWGRGGSSTSPSTAVYGIPGPSPAGRERPDGGGGPLWRLEGGGRGGVRALPRGGDGPAGPAAQELRRPRAAGGVRTALRFRRDGA